MLVLVAGCGGESSGGNERAINRADLGGKWPLTVESGMLRCEGSGGVGDVTITTPDGTTYWVNGLAKGRHRFADFNAIWADDPDLQGLKVDAGALTDAGLALCK